MNKTEIPQQLIERLHRGCVIPAQPLALDSKRKLSEPHQRGLTRYYAASGAGGIAVGVHSTQFEIHDPKTGLYQPVLELAAHTADECAAKSGISMIKIAGVLGRTEQALREAELARSLGYHAALLMLKAFKGEPVSVILEHCRKVAEVIPLVGFYLQPAVGGMLLPVEFWRGFAAIDNVIAIKMAPFNRYQTLDVVRAVCETGRDGDIALYTGNDDNIIADLCTIYRIQTANGPKSVRITGGLLGHWSVWTQNAVAQLEAIRKLRMQNAPLPEDMLTLGIEVTDSNAAFFDAKNNFAGCLAGINEMLRRRGQVPSSLCLSDHEKLSPGQAEELDRVQASYPHLNDDAFVEEHLDEWLS